MKWLITFISYYFIGSILNGLIEMDYDGGASSGILKIIYSFQQVDFSWNIFQTAGSIISAGGTFLAGFWEMLTFDYSFFDGYYVIFRIIFCILPVAFIIMIALRKVDAEPQ
jgi:hypothetical protein